MIHIFISGKRKHSFIRLKKSSCKVLFLHLKRFLTFILFIADSVPEGLSGPNLIESLPATITSTTVDYSSVNPIVSSSFQEETKTSTPQAQKQSYFTSILSSLPNLSLSSITGDNSKQEYQEAQQVVQHVDPYVQNPYGPPAGPPTFIAANPYDSRVPTFEANPAPSQQLPPPSTLPPSGSKFLKI